MIGKKTLLSITTVSVLLAFVSGQSVSPGVGVVPYGNQTQLGYHVLNITTYGKAQVAINNTIFNMTQNYISPNQSGVTVNKHSYYLNIMQPIELLNYTNVFVELISISYTPIEHTVDFNIYEVQIPVTSTTSTIPQAYYLNVTNSGHYFNVTFPASGYYSQGERVEISAKPVLARSVFFTSWTGTGPGNYTGTNNTVLIRMDSNIREVANYRIVNISTTTIRNTSTTLNMTTTQTGNPISNVISWLLSFFKKFFGQV